MNEVSNFDTNVWDDKLNCPENKWDDPPYETSTLHNLRLLFPFLS